MMYIDFTHDVTVYRNSNYTGSEFDPCLERFGSGVFSLLPWSMTLLPRQLPRTVLQVFWMTRRAWVFVMNSFAEGFSLTLPRCLC